MNPGWIQNYGHYDKIIWETHLHNNLGRIWWRGGCCNLGVHKSGWMGMGCLFLMCNNNSIYLNLSKSSDVYVTRWKNGGAGGRDYYFFFEILYILLNFQNLPLNFCFFRWPRYKDWVKNLLVGIYSV